MTAAAAIAVALLCYAYFGYPIVIGLLSSVAGRGKPRSTRDPSEPLPMVSICLPVFNGAGHLRDKVSSLLAQDYPAERMELLIYCDGCTDETPALARELAQSEAAAGRIRVFENPARLGKPTGLNTLGPAARGELLLLNDVRQPLSPNAVRSMAEALEDPTVGCATGNLILSGTMGSGVYWRYENWIRSRESAFRGVVGMTGPIAMTRREDLKPLPEDLILDDVWIPMQLALQGKRVAFVAEAEAHDSSFANEREFKRKVRTLAGNYQLFSRMPALLIPFVNPIWFETFSHKIMRLIAPWLMIALLPISLAGAFGGTGLEAAAMGALFLGQAAFYLAAAVGPRGGKIPGVARTFVVLNAAALLGLWRHLRGSQRVTW